MILIIRKIRKIISDKALLYKTLMFIVILYIAITIIALYPTSQYFLIIKEYHSGKTLWVREIKSGDWFYHEYVHSVELTSVIEKYKMIGPGDIRAMESWTRSFGAGLPYEFNENVEIRNGVYIIKDLNRPVDVIHMMPSHLQPHTFHFHDETLLYLLI